MPSRLSVKETLWNFFGTRQERIVMPYSIDVIQKNNKRVNIAVIYNLLNDLKFLHLQLLEVLRGL
jgi:hypothetical protein